MNRGFNNGFEYVDLNLPSKTLWSVMNVGANKPTDAGLYFQWGDIIGYNESQVGKDKQFKQNDYKWGIKGNYEDFTKYNTTGATLELEDDAANHYMRGNWHIPSPEQIRELLDNTTSTWETIDDINGRIFTSKNNGKSIFIPAVGVAYNGSVINNEWYGYVWSSMLHRSSVVYGQFLYFNSGGVYLDYYDRNFGHSVRGVIG